MNRFILLASSALLLMACAATRSSSCSAFDEVEPPPNIALPEEMRLSLHVALEAHCRCDFPESARALFPLGVEGSGDWQRLEDACLGPMRILSMSTDTEDLVAIFLRREQAVYVMVAHLVENEWLFSWPAETGESASDY